MKNCLILSFGILFIAAFYTGKAQSIGKWNRVSIKQFYTPEAAKKLGKSFSEVSTSTTGTEIIEFKADHSYTKTLSGKYQPTPIVLTGTWSEKGNQLVMKMDPKQADPKYNSNGDASSTSTTIVAGDTMTITSPVSANNPMASKMQIDKIEETFKKI
jgi:hypothetical protein